jgi:DNA-binding NarL/FixJ family response regulator
MADMERQVGMEALPRPIRVVLAQQFSMEREIVERHLASQDGFQLVGQTGDWSQVSDVCEGLRPDVLVLDMERGRVVLDTTRLVHKRLPATGIMVVSEQVEPAYVGRVLAAGALAFVDKRTYSTEDFNQAMRAAAGGERYISPTVYPELVDAAVEALVEEGSGRYLSPYEGLTPREREVLGLVAEGHTTKQIADLLGVSFRTVENHRGIIMKKLGVKGVAGMVRFALERQLYDRREV